jgi:GNAT superfamily N-acetyltransferase
MTQTWTRGEYTITTDRRRLDIDVIHGFLSQSYWAKGRSRERVLESIEASLVFGLFWRDQQVGFARVVTDRITIAFLADVFVVESHRDKGLGTWLAETVTSLPELQRVRRWMLGTRDAHGLYSKFGFVEPKPGILMERLNLESDGPGRAG